eukprot:5885044-Karenia_brevis.AAC.1
MEAATARMVKGKMIIDGEKVFEARGRQRPSRCGWKIRIFTPEGHAAGLPYQHSKQWIFDETVYFCGSTNCTHNALHKCKDADVVTREINVVRAAVRDFERTWERSVAF